MTVGSGITPDLLTPQTTGPLAGLQDEPAYRRWGISPRPENSGNLAVAGAVCKGLSGKHHPHRNQGQHTAKQQIEPLRANRRPETASDLVADQGPDNKGDKVVQGKGCCDQ